MATKSMAGKFAELAPAGRSKEYVRYPKSDAYVRPDQIASSAKGFQFAPAYPESLTKLVLKAMKQDNHDFQPVHWIADRLASDPAEIRAVLEKLPEVRRPVYGGGKFADWYRLRTKGLTRRERLARLRALVTFEPMDDNF